MSNHWAATTLKTFFIARKSHYQSLVSAEKAKNRPGDKATRNWITSPKIEDTSKGVTLEFSIGGTQYMNYEFGKGKYIPIKRMLKFRNHKKINGVKKIFVNMEEGRVVDGKDVKVASYYRRVTKPIYKKANTSRNKTTGKLQKATGVEDWFLSSKRFAGYKSNAFIKRRYDAILHGISIPNAILYTKNEKYNWFLDYAKGNRVWSFSPTYPIGKTFGIPWKQTDGVPIMDLSSNTIDIGDSVKNVSNPNKELVKNIADAAMAHVLKIL